MMTSEFSSTQVLHKADSQTSLQHGSGIGILRAAFIMATQVSGTGVLALPMAASDAGGWTGVGLMVALCLNAVYADMHLGMCWIIMERHYPELKGPLRNPYPTIGEKAFGPWARRLIAVTMQVTLMGTGTVFLLLASEILERQLSPYVPEMNACLWMLVLAAILCPAMWLGSPKDFWGFGILGLTTIVVASIIATIQSVIDLNNAETPPDTSLTLTVQSFFLGFGSIMFAFGGAGIFPTVQNDMEKRERFPVAVVIAFSAILVIYLPVTTSGFAAYGHDAASNIFASMSPTVIVTVAEIFVAIDLLVIFILTTNPAMQFFENLLDIDSKFGWKRCAVRGSSLLFMLFLAETVQDFGKVLSLVGGSTAVLLNLVFPAVLYLRLSAKLEPEKPVEIWRRCYLYFVIALGAIGGTAATVSAFADMFSSGSFRKPCYVP